MTGAIHRLAVAEAHLVTARGEGVAGGRGDGVASIEARGTGGGVAAGELGDAAKGEIIAGQLGAEIGGPDVVVAVNRGGPGGADAAAGERVNEGACVVEEAEAIAIAGGDPGLAEGVEREALEVGEAAAGGGDGQLDDLAANEGVAGDAAGAVGSEAAAVGDPRGAVGGDLDVERAGFGIFLEVNGVGRIAVEEDVNAVVAVAGDPDVVIGVGGNGLSADGAALVAIGRREGNARGGEPRDAAVAAGRRDVGVAAPAIVAHPYGTIGCDADAEAGAEDAATEEGRLGGAIAPVGGLAIGLEDDVEDTGVGCALHDVVGDPGVAVGVEHEVGRAAEGVARAAGVVDLDDDGPGVGRGDEARGVGRGGLGKVEEVGDVLLRETGEVGQGLQEAEWREAAGRSGKAKEGGDTNARGADIASEEVGKRAGGAQGVGLVGVGRREQDGGGVAVDRRDEVVVHAGGELEREVGAGDFAALDELGERVAGGDGGEFVDDDRGGQRGPEHGDKLNTGRDFGRDVKNTGGGGAEKVSGKGERTLGSGGGGAEETGGGAGGLVKADEGVGDGGERAVGTGIDVAAQGEDATRGRREQARRGEDRSTDDERGIFEELTATGGSGRGRFVHGSTRG